MRTKVQSSRGSATDNHPSIDWRLHTVLLAAWVFVATQGKTFLSLDAESIATDGYAAQVAFIQEVMAEDGSILHLKPLYWIHGARASVALAFTALEQLGGAWLVGFFFYLLLKPLARVLSESTRPLAGIALPIAMVALSYRSVLVVASIGYLVLYIRYTDKSWYLALSLLLANLSSGAVLASMLIAGFIGPNYRKNSYLLRAYAIVACASLVISLQDKVQGFLAGDAGYDSTIRGATGILALLSRSTIFISFSEGNIARGAIYISILAVALFAIIQAGRQIQYGAYLRIFILTLPAFFLEGLGVLALLFPVLMFSANIPFPLKPKALNRRPYSFVRKTHRVPLQTRESRRAAQT